MTTRRYGYGRVSSRDQHTLAQHDALIAADVQEEFIYVENASTRLAQRPKLEEVRKQLREGDTLVITKVDRLARSLLDLITIADDLKEKGIKLEVLSGTFNRDDPMGEAFFQMTGVFAQLERDMIRMRTNEGLAARRARGVVGGRKPKLSDKDVEAAKILIDATDPETGRHKYTIAEVAAQFNVDRKTMYGYLNPTAKEAKNTRRREARKSK